MELQTVADVREFFRDALQTCARASAPARPRPHRALHRQPARDVLAHRRALRAGLGAHATQATCTATRRGRTTRRTTDSVSARCSASAMSRSSSRDSLPAASRAGRSTSTTTSRWAAAPTARSRRRPTAARSACSGSVFAELEDKFQPLVDALNEIGEGAARHSPRDVLRLYELWHKTGSQRAHRLLLKLGIRPVPAGTIAN